MYNRNIMKVSKIYIAATAVMLSCTLIFAQEVGDKFYKEVTVNNEKVSRLVEYVRIFENDANGNDIHYKDSSGSEKWAEYDLDGREIHLKSNSGYERWSEYDSNGNKIYYKDSSGSEEWSEYDYNNNVIHYKNINGLEEWYKYEYDLNENIIYLSKSNWYEVWYEYDFNNKCVHMKSKLNSEPSLEIWMEYNSNGDMIYCTATDPDDAETNFEEWNEYTYWENGEMKTMKYFIAIKE